MVEALLLIMAFAGVALVLAFRLAIVQAENRTLSAESATDHDIIASLRAQIAAFDHDGDGKAGGSRKRA